MLVRKVKGPRSNTHRDKQPAEKRPVKSVTKELDALRLKLQNARNGYHQEAYGVMARALAVALVLRANKKLARNFVRRVRPQPADRKDGAAINLVTEVMVYVMGAATDSGRKLAWKRGRVIEYLHEEGVKIENIPSQIKTRGGIEAVFKQAVKAEPRRKRSEAEQHSGTKTSGPAADESRVETTEDDEDAAGPSTNDKKVVMPMIISLSDRDMIMELPRKFRLRLVVVRVNREDAQIMVRDVKRLSESA
jgi:hypothetical protein